MDTRTPPFSLKFCLALALLALLLSGCQATRANPGSLLFQDDFSKDAGWLVGRDSSGLIEYAGGGIRIYVSRPAAARLTVPRLSFEDVRIDVDTAKLGGPDDNSFGLLCRYQDAANFYFFEISSDGYYGIGKYKDGVLSLIGATQMQSHTAIHQGAALNHLRAECAGSRLSFFVNGEKVAGVEDHDLQSGDIGLIAGSLKDAGTDVLFDNLSVLQP